METGRAVAGLSCAVFLSELRLRESSRRAARRCGRGGVRLGAQRSVHRVDDHSVLVDQSVLRTVAVFMPHPRRTACARTSPADRTDRRGRLFSDVSAGFHVRAAGQRRHPRDVLRRADQFRQAVQSGTVAAYRVAGDPVGSVPSPATAASALAAARLVGTDRGIGADHLSTSLHRYPDRRTAGCVLFMAVAVGCCKPVARGTHRARPKTQTAGVVVCVRCGRVFCICDIRGRYAVAVLAGRRTADGGAALRFIRRRWLSEKQRWAHCARRAHRRKPP
mgnify:CR=1 FL=1